MSGTIDRAAPAPLRSAAAIFLLFAFPYFMSANLRAINAVIAPELTQEFALSASQLGLLSSAYFVGFAALQLPLGRWLDRHGPRRVECAFLAFAVAGCMLFAAAGSFDLLVLARTLLGFGVSACLMAPFAGYRQWFAPALQTRLSTWMLMSGSLGMIASTLPVQWLLPYLGWRGVFALAAALLLAALAAIWWLSPQTSQEYQVVRGSEKESSIGYLKVYQHPYMVALMPLCWFTYGGLLALQTLWVGPWLTRVHGLAPAQAAWGVMTVHLSMLCAFLAWGALLPRWVARGREPLDLIVWCTPAGIACLAWIAWAGPQAPTWAWAAALVGLTPAAIAQIHFSHVFPREAAGRANGAMNFQLMLGTFAVQWGLGLAADAFGAAGLGEAQRFQGALALLVAVMVLSQGWLLARRRRALAAAAQNA
jgi:predicted MFS family arabinose efflux permease